MKKLLIIAITILATTSFTQAQRYCVIDSKYILENLPDYKNAQDKLDEVSAQWQKEVDAKGQQVKKMYNSYQAEKVMLSGEMQTKREEEIVKREDEAKKLQRKYFGQDGEIFKKRQELVKPIQDKVYNAIQKMASNKNYDIIFDKSAGISVFYSDTKLDKSKDILLELGVSNPGKR
jgi:outer membrane protein